MLWLCLRFPALPLEVFPPSERAAVVMAQQRVVCGFGKLQCFEHLQLRLSCSGLPGLVGRFWCALAD